MEQFMKLPPLQKAGVLAAILVVIAGGGYFMLIEPEIGRKEQNNKLLRKARGELKGVLEKASEAELRKLRRRKDRLVEEDKENRKMLPTSDEVPDFIESVQRDAVASRLRVSRFDRLKTQHHELVNAIPVKMTVEGSMLHLISFMRIYSGSDRRMITIDKLLIEHVKADLGALKKELEPTEPTDILNKVANKTDAEKKLQLIKIARLAQRSAKVRATFVAYAYTWTGKPPPEGKAAKKVKKFRT